MNVKACQFINTVECNLNRNAYSSLHEDGRHLIQTWLDIAKSRREYAPFDSFIFAWISFNGWASCVTDKERDIDIVQIVANCTDLQDRFTELQSAESDFADVVNSFAKLWPIFKTRDVRKYYDYSPPPGNREDIIKEYLNHADIHFAPDCTRYHKKRNEEIPKDWPHTLHTIYRVRCNLFHGGKSPHLENDVIIVKSACDVLMDFMTKTNIIA